MTVQIRRKRASLAQISRSISESLESRLFLSISSSILAGPELTAGNVATYSYNDVSGGSTVDSGTYTVTAVGDKNFGGQAAFESDDTTVPASGGTTIKKTYLAQTSQGLVDYGDNTLVDGSTTIINNYNPPSVVFPATVVAGQTYTLVSTGTQTNSDKAGLPPTSIDNTVTATLSSDSTTPVTVPFGTFDCYVITGSTHNVDDTSQPTQSIDYTQTYYIAAGVGLVKEVVVFAPDAQGNGGSTTTYQLTSFDDAERLVIQKPVPNVGAGDPISPAITVAVEDSSGNVVTDSDATTVMLNIAGVNAGNPIAGNTAPIVNGIATFSDVVLSKAASYQLQPSDDVNDPGVISNKFTVGGDTLAFAVQPKSSDVDEPLILKVKALTQKGKVDTALTDTLQLGLNIVSGGAGAVLGGTTSVAFKGGIASFTPTAGVVLNAPGSYTLSATAMSAGASDQSITSITSDAFAIAGYHLVFSKPPGTVDVFDPVPLTVSLETAHGKVDKLENSAQVQLTLNTVVGGEGAVLQGTVVATFKAGVATFPASAAPTINGGGTFTFTATETGAADPTAPANSRNFIVEPYRLKLETKYLKLPILATEYKAVTTATTSYLIFSLVTAKGKPITTSMSTAAGNVVLPYLPSLTASLIPVGPDSRSDDSLNWSQFSPFGGAGEQPFYNSQGSLTVNFPGKYMIHLTPGDFPAEPNEMAAPSAVAAITVGPYQSKDLVLRATGPKVVTAGDNFNVNAAIYFPDDVGGDPLGSSFPFVGITVYAEGPGGYLGQSVLAGTVGQEYTSTQDPVTSKYDPTPIGPMFITTPGTYKLYAEIASNGVFNGGGYQGFDTFDPATATPVASIGPVLIGVIKVLAR